MAGDADGVREGMAAAEDGSGGSERREAGEAADTAAARWLVYCGDIAGGRVQRNGDGGGCGKDGDAADTGERTTTGLRDVCPTAAPSRRWKGVVVSDSAGWESSCASSASSCSARCCSSLMTSESERRSGGWGGAEGVKELPRGVKGVFVRCDCASCRALRDCHTCRTAAAEIASSRMTIGPNSSGNAIGSIAAYRTEPALTAATDTHSAGGWRNEDEDGCDDDGRGWYVSCCCDAAILSAAAPHSKQKALQQKGPTLFALAMSVISSDGARSVNSLSLLSCPHCRLPHPPHYHSAAVAQHSFVRAY